MYVCVCVCVCIYIYIYMHAKGDEEEAKTIRISGRQEASSLLACMVQLSVHS